jgi:hypothetical protein
MAFFEDLKSDDVVKAIEDCLGFGWIYQGDIKSNNSVPFEHEFFTKGKASWWLRMQIWAYRKGLFEVMTLVAHCFLILSFAMTVVVLMQDLPLYPALIAMLITSLIYWIVFGYEKRVAWKGAVFDASENVTAKISEYLREHLELREGVVSSTWIKSFDNKVYKVLSVTIAYTGGQQYYFTRSLTH